jgi:hypothetical protein
MDTHVHPTDDITPPPADVQPPPHAGIITWLRDLPRQALAGLAAGVLVVAGGGIVLGLSLTAGPSWPHPWCQETMTALYNSPRQTFGQFTNELQYLENIGAPTGQLLQDENSLSSDMASAQNDSVFQLGTDLAAEQADITTVGSDAGQLNTTCGKPVGYDRNQLAVPSSG